MRCGITILIGATIDITELTGIIGTGTGIITGITGGGRIITIMDTIGAGIAITRMVTTTAISTDLRFLSEAGVPFLTVESHWCHRPLNLIGVIAREGGRPSSHGILVWARHEFHK
jgi:hypothetical protein